MKKLILAMLLALLFSVPAPCSTATQTTIEELLSVQAILIIEKDEDPDNPKIEIISDKPYTIQKARVLQVISSNQEFTADEIEIIHLGGTYFDPQTQQMTTLHSETPRLPYSSGKYLVFVNRSNLKEGTFEICSLTHGAIPVVDGSVRIFVKDFNLLPAVQQETQANLRKIKKSFSFMIKVKDLSWFINSAKESRNRSNR